MNFCSDNTTCAAPEIMAALVAANSGQAMPYGEDDITAGLADSFGALFETEVEVFPVGTGTAGNALALSLMVPPYGAIYCHREAHIEVDECGAPELFSGGAKLVVLDGDDGKIPSGALEAALEKVGGVDVHRMPPSALSLTQQTEWGTLYSPREVTALSEVAHGYGLNVHMDGARFANAVASLGCTPAEVSWRAGVDILTFGATKNGALAAEAVIIFKSELAREAAYRHKRVGQLFSKMRFISVQLEAYITDGLWLENAEAANAQAQRLAAGIEATEGVSLLHPVQGNELFVTMTEPVLSGLLADGCTFNRWTEGGVVTARLVTAFNTAPKDVDAFIISLQKHAGNL
ncbi:MAG: low specificity L-threonine aldolase [Alphaproteobacteria bacterium]